MTASGPSLPPQADGKYPLRRDTAYQDDIITTHTRQACIRDDSQLGTVAGRYRGLPGVFSYGRRLYQAETNDRNPTAGFFHANGRRIDTHSGATRHSGSSDYTISYATVNIDARIEGNGFTGGDRQPVRSKGHFYGANAAEQGGIFYDSRQEVSGSFGAKKDDTALQPPAPPVPPVRDDGIWRASGTAQNPLPQGVYRGDILQTAVNRPQITDAAQIGTIAGQYAAYPGVFDYRGRQYVAQNEPLTRQKDVRLYKTAATPNLP